MIENKVIISYLRKLSWLSSYLYFHNSYSPATGYCNVNNKKKSLKFKTNAFFYNYLLSQMYYEYLKEIFIELLKKRTYSLFVLFLTIRINNRNKKNLLIFLTVVNEIFLSNI